MNGNTALILDLAAQGRATLRQWRRCEGACLEALAPARVLPVRGAEEAEAAARQAAREGAHKLVAVGGTATAHGVLNALMALAEPHRAALKFGLLSLGRPGHWSRTLELPRSLGRQLEVLRAGHTLPFDVGRVECLDPGGRPITRHFLNGACFGIPGQIRGEWRAAPGEPRHALHALGRTLRLLSGREGAWVRLEQEGESAAEIYRGPWVAGLVMVGRFYPGFGEVAPRADPADGALDLVGVTGRPDWRALAWLAGLLPRVLIPPACTLERSGEFHATDAAAPVYLELDGIAAGILPARFSILPRQLPTIVPAVPARLMKPKFKPIPAIVERPLVAGHLKAKWPLGA
jgi:diacylglycerol kinase (ATP)